MLIRVIVHTMVYNHISQFMLLVELGSISKVAEETGIAPITISKNIKLLEERLSCSLINFYNTGAKPTEIGMSFYEQLKPDYISINDTLEYFKNKIYNDVRKYKCLTVYFPVGFVIDCVPSLLKVINSNPLNFKLNVKTYHPHSIKDSSFRLKFLFQDNHIIIIPSNLIYLLNQDKWKLSYSVISNDYLYGSKNFISRYNIKNIEDVKDIDSVGLHNTVAQKWIFKNKENESETTTIIKKHKYKVDLLAAQRRLILSDLAIGVIPEIAWNNQKYDNLVKLFPEYSLGQTSFSILYNIDNHFTRESKFVCQTIKDIYKQ